jgi:SEC-C motif-containing protein
VPCPCGQPTSYDACCGRLHRGAAQAETAEELMRSRYAAYAVGEIDHVFRTWHPRTRPDDLSPDPGLAWLGLEIVETLAGGPDEETGEVEFRARYRTAAGEGVLHERSRFVRRAGRWVYVDGDVG